MAAFVNLLMLVSVIQLLIIFYLSQSILKRSASWTASSKSREAALEECHLELKQRGEEANRFLEERVELSVSSQRELSTLQALAGSDEERAAHKKRDQELVQHSAESEGALRKLRADCQSCEAALISTRAKLESVMKKADADTKSLSSHDSSGDRVDATALHQLQALQEQVKSLEKDKQHYKSKLLSKASSAAPSSSTSTPLLASVAPTRRLLEGITLATHMDPSRIRLEMKEIPALWSGPIALAVFASSPEQVSLSTRLLSTLAPAIRERLDYSIFHYSNPHNESAYPVNQLREQAMSLVRTELVLLVDGDFVPDAGLYDFFVKSGNDYQRLRDRALHERIAFVIPCFMQGMRFNPRPANFTALLDVLDKDIFAPGDPTDPRRPHHSPTDYTKWRTAEELYAIDYEFWYEPYVVLSMRVAPLWDPRFVYYGMDKVAYTYSLHRHGFQFEVVPQHFIVHVPHPRDDWYADSSGQKVSDSDKPKLLLRQFLKEWNDEVYIDEVF